MKTLLTTAATITLLLALACSSPPANHVVTATVTGTGVKIDQNLLTQLYQLVLGRAQVNVSSIPVARWTNSDGSVHFSSPDVVVRYEVDASNQYFGGAKVTWTIASGTDAVKSLVGGAAPPINSKVLNLSTPQQLTNSFATLTNGFILFSNGVPVLTNLGSALPAKAP